MRGALLDRAPTPDPSEQGVDQYLYYLVSTEVLAGLITFPSEAWARGPSAGDPTTDRVKLALWRVVGGSDTTWRRRWDDAHRI